MNWVVYMLKCNDSSIYTGISNNLNRRLDTHAKGNGSKYVRARLPFKLIYTEAVSYTHLTLPTIRMV